MRMSSFAGRLITSASLVALLGTACSRGGSRDDDLVKVSSALTAGWPTQVIVAQNSFALADGTLATGNLAALTHSAGPTLSDSVEGAIGQNVHVTGTVSADSIRLRAGAVVTGAANYNDLTNNGTIQGGLITPLTLPLAIGLPAFPTFTAGATAVQLARSEVRTLAPGSYGTVKLLAGTRALPTTLRLSGGTYNCLSLDIGQDSRVECTGSCTLRIADKLLPGANSYLGPAAGASFGAEGVEIFVAGVNGNNGAFGGTPQSVQIGTDNTVVARIYAPNGTLKLRDGTLATGAFIGRDVDVGPHVHVTAGGTNLCAGVTCAAPDQCHTVGTCDPTTGQCSNPAKTDGATCDDANACTQSDSCQTGVCVPGDAVVCFDPGDQCHLAAICDPATGLCVNPQEPDATACEDGNPCTLDDRCQAGVCQGDTVTCSALDQCHVAGTCDLATGQCTQPAALDGTSCNDGSTCTFLDVCVEGTCVGAVANSCFTPQVTPVDPTRPTTVAETTAFLYTGPDAVQRGVAPGTIEAAHAAVLRGIVKLTDGSPLPGVVVRVLGHPELGVTLTRDDGTYDLAVNGGGLLTLTYVRIGYLEAQRQILTPWLDFRNLPEVILTPLDPALTVVDLGSPELQVVQGSVVSDADGSRQATLMFSPGTTGTMFISNFDTRPISALSVRATEYTVGPNGPKAMPAPLPPNSGYTYAVALTIDEAIAAGAKRVEFSQPVGVYVENFIGAPTGSLVPVGALNRDTGAWVPGPNGRVVEILEIFGGLAELDIDGSGVAAAAPALAALGISDAERAQLTGLYLPGQTLWRAAVTHFSDYDINWPYGISHSAFHPHVKPPVKKKPEEDPCKDQGSIIECDNQVLGQELPVVGTPFSLSYRSSRFAGDRSSRILSASVTSVGVPLGANRIETEIEIAGQKTTLISPPFPNQSALFEWDGRDAYGRSVVGAQPVTTMRISNVYPVVYETPIQRDFVFGCFSGRESQGIFVNRAAAEVSLASDYTFTGGASGEPSLTLGSLNPAPTEFGGWTLSVHHAYDPVARVLHRGDGGQQQANDVKLVASAVAGDGFSLCASGDGGPAKTAGIGSTSLAVARNGDVILSSGCGGGLRIRRVDANGVISTIAGGGFDTSSSCSPATHCEILPEKITIGSDGSVYFTEPFRGRIRKLTPDGEIVPVAGHFTGFFSSGFSGDGDQAPGAVMAFPRDVAVAPDGTVYVADTQNNRIRKVSTDGIINTIVGDGTAGSSPDGTPADLTRVNGPFDLELGGDGSLYFTDGSHRIRRIGVDGILATVVGDGTAGYAGDGGPAVAAQTNCSFDCALSVTADGSILFADTGHIRKVGPDGIIWTIAGNGASPGITVKDGTGALATAFQPISITMAQDRSIYVSDPGRFRRLAPPLTGVSPGETTIAGVDGAEVYVFGGGYHLRTLDALTGTIAYAFQYDAGHLTSIVDRSGLVTQIERDGSGRPAAIVAPGGQRTVLGIDANGFLGTVADPAGDTTAFEYGPTGLMSSLTDPRQNRHTFVYDSAGQLQTDADPAGGFSTLVRSGPESDVAVLKSSALGRMRLFHTRHDGDGSTQHVVTDSAGLTQITATAADGTRTSMTPDGMTVVSVPGADPRFGMQAPFVQGASVTTPAGRQVNATTTRSVTTDPANAAVLRTQTDTTIINGRSISSSYDAATRTMVQTSAAGRTTTTVLDARGRPATQAVANLQPTTFSFDARGRLQTVTAASGALARTSTVTYDVKDRIHTFTDPLLRTQTFSYDDADRVVTHTLADGGEIAYSYDANGNLSTITPPGRAAHAFTFSSVDAESDYTAPDVGAGAVVTSYAYNLDRQPTAVTRPDGSIISMGYETPSGRLSTITFPAETGTTTRTATQTYSPTSGQLSTLTTSDGEGLFYSYDGRLITAVTASGTVAGSVSMTYNNDFRPVSETVVGDTVALGYDADGLPNQLGALTIARDPANGSVTGTSLSSVGETRQRTSFGELLDAETKFGASTLFKQHFTRDAVGRIETKVETVDGVASTYTYSYNSAGRLWQVMKGGVLTATYLYDANGNRVSKTTTGVESGTTDGQDRLLTYGNLSYVYTPNGDLKTKTDTSTGAITTYGYDGLGNLRRVDLPDGRVIEYVIDGVGRRIAKKVDGTVVRRWLYRDVLYPIAELDGAGAVVSRFVGTEYFVKGGITYRVVKDHLGSPRLVVDVASGSVAQELEYDEFGRMLSDTSPGFQPLGFAGGLYDVDTGLVRFGLRDYDADTGRWTAKDVVGFAARQTNLYSYVDGDPINRIDPTGADLFSAVDSASNFLTGVADAVSFGLGPLAREAWDDLFDDNLSSVVDMCSTAYKAGTWASLALGAGRAAYAGAAKALTIGRAATLEGAEAASAARNVLRRVFRGGLPAEGKAFADALEAYETPEAIIAAAGRTSSAVNAVGFDAAIGGGIGVARGHCSDCP